MIPIDFIAPIGYPVPLVMPIGLAEAIFAHVILSLVKLSP